MSRNNLEKTIRRAFDVSFNYSQHRLYFFYKRHNSFIENGIQVWQERTNLEFTFKRTGVTHITIAFYEKAHGDGENFDGPGMKFPYFLQSFMELDIRRKSVTVFQNSLH